MAAAPGEDDLEAATLALLLLVAVLYAVLGADDDGPPEMPLLEPGPPLLPGELLLGELLLGELLLGELLLGELLLGELLPEPGALLELGVQNAPPMSLAIIRAKATVFIEVVVFIVNRVE